MNSTIDEIISEVRVEYPNLSSLEIERIFDTQFLVLENNIQCRSKKVVNIMYIGKFKPTKWFIDNYELVGKAKRDYIRLVE
jgi:hypothetical protein